MLYSSLTVIVRSKFMLLSEAKIHKLFDMFNLFLIYTDIKNFVSFIDSQTFRFGGIYL